MTRHTPAVKPIIHTPMRLEWTDEKLQALSQEQLLTLLENLDHQRAIGRIGDSAGAPLDQRIAALLTDRGIVRRRKRMVAATAAARAARLDVER